MKYRETEGSNVKQLGINMSVANLEAFALTQGITKAFNSMTQGEQTLLRYQYLMQATSDAQGDFARTSGDSFANMKRQLETNLESIKATIGGALLEPLKNATSFLNNFLSELTKEKKETILDKIADIKIDEVTKITQIQEVAAQATSLLDTLEKINNSYGLDENSNVIKFFTGLDGSLSGLDTTLGEAGDLAGELGGIADSANGLNITTSFNWGSFVGAIDGLKPEDGYNLQSVANALATKLGGDPKKWENLLQAIGSNAAGAIAAVNGDNGQTEAFLEGVAAGADDLTTDYSGYWNSLLGVLGDKAEDAISGLSDGSNAGDTLSGIASGANALGLATGAKWQSFADALDGIDVQDGSNLQGIADALATNVGGDAGKWTNLLQAIGNNAGAAIAAVSGDEGKTKEFLASVAESADDLNTDYSVYWNNLLTVLGDDAGDAIKSLAGGESAGATLTGIASGANSLGLTTGVKWQTFADAIDGISVDDGASLQSVADALATELGGDANKWTNLLQAISGNAKGAIDAVSGDAGKTKEFLEGVAAGADDLTTDYSEYWDRLLGALGDKAGAAISALDAGTATGGILTSIAGGANLLNSDSPQLWRTLLNSLNAATGVGDVLKGISGKNVTDLAKALSGEDLDTTKAEAWQIFLDALNVNPEALAQLTGKSAEETSAWLNKIGDAAKSLSPTDAESWNKLLTAFVGGLPELFKGENGEQFFDLLTQEFLAMGSDSEIARAGLASLGMQTDDITNAQDKWLGICKELVKVIPGLSDIINLQTGEIKGGTQAVKDYIEAWTAENILKARLNALNEMQKLYEQELNFDWFSKIAAQKAKAKSQLKVREGMTEEDAEAFLENMAAWGRVQYRYANTGIDPMAGVTVEAGMHTWEHLNPQIKEWYDTDPDVKKAYAAYKTYSSSGLGQDAKDELNAFKDVWGGYEEALTLLPEVQAEIAAQQEGLKKDFNLTDEGLQELTATTEEAAHEMTLMEKAASGDADALDEVETALKNAEAAFKDLADYQEKVRAEVKQTVDSTIKGFDSIGKKNEQGEWEFSTPMQKAKDEVKDLRKEMDKLKKEGKSTAEIELKISAKEGEYTSVQSMTKSLDSQLAYMQEYQKLLAQARAMGVSEEILSSLSDGSQESFDYLYALTTTGGNIDELNEKYRQVQEESAKFTDELTRQKLAADDAYQTLVEIANEAIEGLNLGEEAKKSVEATVNGIVAGLSENKDKVKEQVDGILAQLARLGAVSYSPFTGTGYGINPFNSRFKLNPESGANGLDYVPYDGYLMMLHQGERIQTAAEADLARRYSYQQPATDIGGAVWSNAPKMGGNVYLDGKVVGRVISDNQANSYRALERSGWQG